MTVSTQPCPVLIDSLSDRWGTDLHRWGKRVWGELHCEVEK